MGLTSFNTKSVDAAIKAFTSENVDISILFLTAYTYFFIWFQLVPSFLSSHVVSVGSFVQSILNLTTPKQYTVSVNSINIWPECLMLFPQLNHDTTAMYCWQLSTICQGQVHIPTTWFPKHRIQDHHDVKPSLVHSIVTQCSLKSQQPVSSSL